MINWARVGELEAEIGEDGFREVAEMFLEEMGEVLERIRASGGTSDIRGDLHFIKGSAMNLGFQDLATLCSSGETAHAAGQTVDFGQIVLSFDQAATQFRARLAT